MAAYVKDIDRGWKRLMTLGERLSRRETYVKVGVLGSAEPRAGEPLQNVDLALVHEFGSPKMGIPERSWIRSTFDAGKGEYQAQLGKLFKALVAGRTGLSRVLGIMGLKVSSDIKRRVTSGTGIPPPNAPATLRRKKALGKGRGDPRTLIDTGRMVNSTSHQAVIDGVPEGGGQ